MATTTNSRFMRLCILICILKAICSFHNPLHSTINVVTNRHKLSYAISSNSVTNSISNLSYKKKITAATIDSKLLYSISLDSSLIPSMPWFIRYISTSKQLLSKSSTNGIYVLAVALMYKLIRIVSKYVSNNSNNNNNNINQYISQVTAALALVPYKVTDTFAHVVNSVINKLDFNFLSVIKNTTFTSLNSSVIPFIAISFKIFIAKIFGTIQSVKDAIGGIFNVNKAEAIDINDWKVCTLYDKRDISQGYSQFRFQLTNPNGILPLNIGQELAMCAVDEKERVFKESYFPVSMSSARGYFDIVVKRNIDDGEIINDKNGFAAAIDNAKLNEEFAIKAGMTIIASCSGILPTLQVLRGILPDRDSSVEAVELLWLNEKEEDYLYNDEIEQLELRHIEKLFVSKVMIRDLYGLNMMKNNEILGSLSSYSDQLAIVCGPDYIITKSRQLLGAIGYPAENILSIPMP